jgi:hypothetical protein
MDELGRFLEFWYGPRRPDYGESEERLGRLSLPHPLRLFYALAGRWPSPEPGREMDYFYTGAAGHHLHDLDHVKLRPDGRLSFFMEYQGDWYGLTLTGGDDPPVWIEGRWDDPADVLDRHRKALPKSKQVSGALSKFLITHCLMTTVYEWENSPHPRISSKQVSDALANWLQRDSADLEKIWEAEPDGCPNYKGTFYLFHQRILVHRSGRTNYKFGALHPQGIELLRNVLGEKA